MECNDAQRFGLFIGTVSMLIMLKVLDTDIQKAVHIIVCPALTLYPFNLKVAPMVAVLFVTLMGVS